MVKISHTTLHNLLNERQLEPVYQKENDQTYILMKVKGNEVPLFFAIRGNGTLLQMVAYIPFELYPVAFGDTARLLHVVNQEFDMPGFGMDEKNKLLFYRLVAPCLNGEFDEHSLNLYLSTIKIALDTFMHAIAVVARGKKEGEKA